MYQDPMDEFVNRYSHHKGQNGIIAASREPKQPTVEDCDGNISLFVRGFLSHPESFWAANYQLLACEGMFGQEQQENAWWRQQIMTSVSACG